MKEIYRSGLLVVTKSMTTGKYTVHVNRVPILVAESEGMTELAEAILKEEKGMTQKEYDLRNANPYDLNHVHDLIKEE